MAIFILFTSFILCLHTRFVFNTQVDWLQSLLTIPSSRFSFRTCIILLYFRVLCLSWWIFLGDVEGQLMNVWLAGWLAMVWMTIFYWLVGLRSFRTHKWLLIDFYSFYIERLDPTPIKKSDPTFAKPALPLTSTKCTPYFSKNSLFSCMYSLIQLQQ